MNRPTRAEFDAALVRLGVALSDLPHPDERATRRINDAYRARSKQLHPDAGGDPAEFVKLTEARDLALWVIELVQSAPRVERREFIQFSVTFGRADIYVDGVRVGKISGFGFE